MKWYWFEDIYIQGSWQGKTYLQIDSEGCLAKYQKEAPEGAVETVYGYALPGFKNTHSHAFQYSMTGVTEKNGGNDFWDWRKMMYSVANTISPQALEDIAAFLYAEMLKAGYTHVVEFNYLYRDQKGNKYKNPCEMGQRLLNAAKKASIRITLLPVFYQRGDFNQEATTDQRRFLFKDVDEYLSLLEVFKKLCLSNPLFSSGVCVHSLRAASEESTREVFKMSDPGQVAHMHIAEQEKEVQSCLHHLGKRPVEWVLDNLELSERYNFVHATHMTKEETLELAKSQANVLICPSTEANLGDGLFNLVDFFHHQGSIAIGSDSNFFINPLEELRLLEYGQRIKYQKRNVLCSSQGDDSGTLLYDRILEGGNKAVGCHETFGFRPGKPFDCVVMDSEHPVLIGKQKEDRLSAMIFSAGLEIFLGTLVGGEWVVKKGLHKKNYMLAKSFVESRRDLI